MSFIITILAALLVFSAVIRVMKIDIASPKDQKSEPLSVRAAALPAPPKGELLHIWPYAF